MKRGEEERRAVRCAMCDVGSARCDRCAEWDFINRNTTHITKTKNDCKKPSPQHEYCIVVSRNCIVVSIVVSIIVSIIVT